MGIPNEYQVDHLFLLVGTNPLPNWVAAQILVRPEHGRLYLVHSSATAPIALRLREPLSALQPELIQVDPTDARSIARTVESHVRPLTGSIGLHYTGGTKAMAVHAYRAMEKTLAGRSPTAVYSYLDAGTFELRVDPDLHEKVLMDVRPTLDQLAALHGARFQKGTPKREKDLHLRKTAAALAASGGLDVWRSWCHDVLRDRAHTGRAWRKRAELVSISLPIPSSDVLGPALVALREELGLISTAVELPLDADLLPRWPFDKRDGKYLCQWLDGDWLEQYVLASIGSVASEAAVHDYAMNLRTDSATSEFDFEFDVAAMVGYQLFGLSCTTSVDKSLAKSKLFEATIRARQLGGDEARVGLVCGCEKAHKYADEVVRVSRNADSVHIFGPRELPELAHHLSVWFRTAQ